MVAIKQVYLKLAMGFLFTFLIAAPGIAGGPDKLLITTQFFQQ